MVLRVVLCDDNCEAMEHYAKKIEQCAEKLNVKIELACFDSGEALFFHLWEMPCQADIIYLDIFMDKLDGMETARKLRSIGCNAQIVFLTSCEDYVYEAFDVGAVHYLLKSDLSDEKFQRIFAKAVELASQKEDELFICEFDGKKTPVPINQIAHFEIWKRVVTAHYGGKSARFYESMENLEKQFARHHFARAHRSYLVHLPHIAEFQPKMLILKTGDRIPIGVTYRDGLSKAFSDYISNTHIHHFRQ